MGRVSLGSRGNFPVGRRGIPWGKEVSLRKYVPNGGVKL